MDERVDEGAGEVADDLPGHAEVLSADHLANRVAVLRAEVQSLTPHVPSVEPPAPPERIQALEQLLGQARDREDRLTTQMIHDQALLARLQTRIDELEALKAATAVTESERASAEARAVDAERRLSLVEAEHRERLVELAQLRSRCETFEADLEALVAEAAAAASGAARAARLEQERDEAWERANAERHHAAEDRARAARAEGRIATLQDELSAAQDQLASATQLSRRIEAVRESPRVLETVGSTAPWVELQQIASTAEPRGAIDELASSEAEAAPVADVDVPAATESAIVDLTQAESAVEEEAPAEEGTPTEEWSAAEEEALAEEGMSAEEGTGPEPSEELTGEPAEDQVRDEAEPGIAQVESQEATASVVTEAVAPEAAPTVVSAPAAQAAFPAVTAKPSRLRRVWDFLRSAPGDQPPPSAF